MPSGLTNKPHSIVMRHPTGSPSLSLIRHKWPGSSVGRAGD